MSFLNLITFVSEDFFYSLLLFLKGGLIVAGSALVRAHSHFVLFIICDATVPCGYSNQQFHPYNIVLGDSSGTVSYCPLWPLKQKQGISLCIWIFKVACSDVAMYKDQVPVPWHLLFSHCMQVHTSFENAAQLSFVVVPCFSGNFF